MSARSRKRLTVTVLVLYLLTWIPAVFIIRDQRAIYGPTVFPVLPFVVLACDPRPSLAGEWSLYLSYGFGVYKLAKVRKWIV